MNDINIYLIRHGQSTGNLRKDQIGQSADEPLTDLGVNQAGRLGKRFLREGIQFDCIWSSTFLRAMATAGIFADVVRYTSDIRYRDDLVEYDPGDWMGKSRTELYSDPATLKKIVYQHMGFKFPGGESYYDVERRACRFIEEEIIHDRSTLALAETKPVNVAVFSHGMTIKCAVKHIAGIDPAFMWKIRLDNTGVCHVVYNDKGWFVNSVNDCGHLLGRD